MRGQGCQRFPLPKPGAGVGQNVALHATPADRHFTYHLYAFPIQSSSFLSETSPRIDSEMCHKRLIIILPVAAVHFVIHSLFYKTNSEYCGGTEAH